MDGFSIPSVPARTCRLDEDWTEVVELVPGFDGAPVSLVGLTLFPRLVAAYDPETVVLPTEAVPIETDIGARGDDGAVPVVIRVAQADLASVITGAADCRFDLVVVRDGLTALAASGLRYFRE